MLVTQLEITNTGMSHADTWLEKLGTKDDFLGQPREQTGLESDKGSWQ